MLLVTTQHDDPSKKIENARFSAEKFVEELLTEGGKTPCDDSVESFHFHENLPEFYDEATFKRGQAFFYKHIFALFFSKFLGLLTILSIPTSLKILVLTGMSSSNLTAYKRYMSTIFHMCVWYQEDFKPGSKLWQSLNEVKKRHNSASKRSCTAGLYRITQKDMAITQFGFMGIALARSEFVGVYNVSEEEWHDFIHVWRVVGYLMGIEDKYNICRESVEETKEICNQLIDQTFRPALNQKNEEFLAMTSYLINGLWVMNPVLDHDVFLFYLYMVLENKTNKELDYNCSSYKLLNRSAIIKLKIMLCVVASLKFNLCRLYHNYIQLLSLWLMKVFPFLAYYKYGRENSHVIIFPREINNTHI